MKRGWKHFPAGAVQVGGELAHEIALTADKITGHTDVDELFVRYFLPHPEERRAPLGFLGYGMLLDAAVKAAAGGFGGETMAEWKNFRIAELISTQRQDGRISIFQGERGIWESHEQAYIVQALCRDALSFGNTAARDAAIRLGDYMIADFYGLTLGVEGAFLLLYRLTREPRFLDFLRGRLMIDAPLARYASHLCVNSLRHVYTVLCRVLAQLEYGALFPESTVGVEKAVKLFDRVRSGGFASITGAIAGGVGCGEIWDRSQSGVGSWGETCATAYLLRLTAKMQEFDPDAVYGDIFERAMYNTLFAARSEDGLRLRYFVPFNEQGAFFPYDTYCCPNNYKRIIFELPESLWLQADDGVAVNLYHESELNSGMYRLRQRTGYPESESAELEILKPGAFTLYLRVPVWCDGFVAECGGERYPGAPGSFVPLRREWRAHDRVRVFLPVKTRLIRGRGAQLDRGAFLRGPLVFGVKRRDNDCADCHLPCLGFSGADTFGAESREITVDCGGIGCSDRILPFHFVRFSDPRRYRVYIQYGSRAADAVDDPLFAFPQDM